MRLALDINIKRGIGSSGGGGEEIYERRKRGGIKKKRMGKYKNLKGFSIISFSLCTDDGPTSKINVLAYYVNLPIPMSQNKRREIFLIIAF